MMGAATHLPYRAPTVLPAARAHGGRTFSSTHCRFLFRTAAAQGEQNGVLTVGPALHSTCSQEASQRYKETQAARQTKQPHGSM